MIFFFSLFLNFNKKIGSEETNHPQTLLMKGIGKPNNYEWSSD